MKNDWRVEARIYIAGSSRLLGVARTNSTRFSNDAQACKALTRQLYKRVKIIKKELETIEGDDDVQSA